MGATGQLLDYNFPEGKEYEPLGALGIDLGNENIVDSDKEILEGKQVEDIRRKNSRLRTDLQHTGPAKRKLKKLSG